MLIPHVAAKSIISYASAEAASGIAMVKANHVRRLCLCPVCGKLGDERAMIKVGPMGCLAHDRCVFEQLGEGTLNLPREQRAKFTLAAVGPDMMRRLVDAA